MKKTGAELALFALEQLGIRFTFGIPGVHNTELYDQLNMSSQITPIMVTHEAGAAFMADAVSRTSMATGTLVVVPAAGLTHAASGIGEAFVDGIPMLVICGGIRNDLEYGYQLHEMDQMQFMSGLTKKCFQIETHGDVIPMIYAAHICANEGEGGPVFVDLPVNIQLMKGEVEGMPAYETPQGTASVSGDELRAAAELLRAAKKPGIFAGWGANQARADLIKLAELLDAPVSTTLQGLGVFPADHGLHTGMGFGPSAVPAAQEAFKDCDCLLAIGTRFSEIPTGSFGVTVPENLIHIDINPDVFGVNYPPKSALQGDAKQILPALLEVLGNDAGQNRRDGAGLRAAIAAGKSSYHKEWQGHDAKARVNPVGFFDALDDQFADDGIIVVDDGNHTFLTAELMSISKSRSFICPTDFNCMGYAVPAAIGAKLANPKRSVAAIVGDGAFTMTCMEILTASRQNLGIVYYVFHDGELSQISQAQKIPYNRQPCTNLDGLNLHGVALATGAAYFTMSATDDAAEVIGAAQQAALQNLPVIVDVAIDYSKKTAFTKGTVQTNLKRLPLGAKARIVGRSVLRHITG